MRHPTFVSHKQLIKEQVVNCFYWNHTQQSACSCTVISDGPYLFNEAILVDSSLSGQGNRQLFRWSLDGFQKAVAVLGLLAKGTTQHLPHHCVELDPAWIITAGPH